MDTGNLTRYRQAILGGDVATPQATAAPTPQLQGVFNNLARAASGGFQAGAARQAVGAIGGAAGAQASQENADAKLQLQQEQDKADAAQKLKDDLADPTKYRQEIAEDGGYQFFDPTGKQIDAKQYSAVTGKHLTDVLKKSQNPNDQEFIKNYGNIEKVGEILQSGSTKDRDKFFKDNPEAKSDYDTLKNHLKREPTFSDIVSTFRQSYPQYFNTKQTLPNDTSGSGGKMLYGQKQNGGLDQNDWLTRIKQALFGG